MTTTLLKVHADWCEIINCTAWTHLKHASANNTGLIFFIK